MEKVTFWPALTVWLLGWVAMPGGTLLLGAPWTLTVPCMNGWTEQVYGKLPAVLKVWVKVKPALWIPESHRPPSLVVEWADAPVQVHLTWSFTLIWDVAGLKAKSMMFTFATAAKPDRAEPRAK